jgi:hypothetical protein
MACSQRAIVCLPRGGPDAFGELSLAELSRNAGFDQYLGVGRRIAEARPVEIPGLKPLEFGDFAFQQFQLTGQAVAIGAMYQRIHFRRSIFFIELIQGGAELLDLFDRVLQLTGVLDHGKVSRSSAMMPFERPALSF